jgi:hypothetical protein
MAEAEQLKAGTRGATGIWSMPRVLAVQESTDREIPIVILQTVTNLGQPPPGA